MEERFHPEDSQTRLLLPTSVLSILSRNHRSEEVASTSGALRRVRRRPQEEKTFRGVALDSDSQGGDLRRWERTQEISFRPLRDLPSLVGLDENLRRMDYREEYLSHLQVSVFLLDPVLLPLRSTDCLHSVHQTRTYGLPTLLLPSLLVSFVPSPRPTLRTLLRPNSRLVVETVPYLLLRKVNSSSSSNSSNSNIISVLLPELLVHLLPLPILHSLHLPESVSLVLLSLPLPSHFLLPLRDRPTATRQTLRRKICSPSLPLLKRVRRNNTRTTTTTLLPLILSSPTLLFSTLDLPALTNLSNLKRTD